MNRLFESFDHIGNATALARTYTVLDSTAAVYGQAGRYGGRCLRGQGASLLRFATGALTFTDPNRVLVGARIRAGLPKAGEGLIIFRNSTNQILLALDLYRDSGTGLDFWFLKVRCGTSVLYTTNSYASDTWIYLEFDVTLDHNGAGAFELRINGNTEITKEDVTTAAQSDTGCVTVQFGPNGESGSGYVDIDDLRIADGGEFYGDITVDHIYPSLQGTSVLNGWTGSAGGNQALLVDDSASATIDDDSTFVSSAGATAAGALFKMSALRVARQHIFAVKFTADARLASAGTNVMGFISVHETDGLEIWHFDTVSSTSYARFSFITEVNQNNAEWTPRDIRKSEFGVLYSTPTPNIRLTNFHVELLVRAPVEVVPNLPTDPQITMALANWETPVQLESTWTSDVTMSVDDSAQSRRSLLSKPIRVMKTELLGLTKANSSAIVGSLSRTTLNATLWPLYCDALRLESTLSGNTILCDTKYRRFSRGQLVAVVHHNLADNTASVGEIAQIQDVYDDRLVLTGALANVYDAGSKIYPLFESEVSLSQEVQLISDRVLLTSVQILEAQGAQTLPSLWEDEEFGYYTKSEIDGRPIYAPSTNWSSAPKKRIFRDGNRSQSGKGSVTLTKGTRPSFVFTFETLNLTREEAWIHLQFMDSRRGRAKTFWFLDLHDTLTPISITRTSMTVQANGVIENYQELYSNLAILTYSGQIIEIEVSTIFDNLDGTWTIMYPAISSAHSVVNVRKLCPKYLVRFNEDGRSESWITDGVCSLTVELIETQVEEEISIPNIVIPTPDWSEIAQIPDLYTWFDTQSNIYHYDALAGVYYRTQPWPLPQNKADRWLDVRQTRPDVLRPIDLPQMMLVEASSGGPISVPYIARFEKQWLNKGHRALVGGPFNFSGHYDPQLDIRERELWDNTKGCTIIIVQTGGTIDQGSAQRLLTWRNSGNHCFYWDSRSTSSTCRIQMFEIPGTEDGTIRITGQDMNDGFPGIWIFRWIPGVSAELIRNGVVDAVAARSPSSFPNVVSYQTDAWFNNYNISQPASRGVVDDNFRVRGLLHSFPAFKRGLTNDELNTIGQFYSRVYGTPWTNLP